MLISGILKDVIPSLPGNTTTAIDETRKYLKATEDLVDTEFIKPIDQALALSVSDHQTLIAFLHKMRDLSETVLTAKDALFSYRFLSQLYFRSRSTGQVTVWPPAEHDMVLSHFQIHLDRLVRTAEGISGTIENWRKSITDARKPFLEFLAAHTSARTSRTTIFIQLAAIGLALVFSTFFLTARDPFSLSKENARLRYEIRELQNRPTFGILETISPGRVDGGVLDTRR